jgi:hypothetical protein
MAIAFGPRITPYYILSFHHGITLRSRTNFPGKPLRCIKGEPYGGIGTFGNIAFMTFGKDHRTYDLSLAILHEEIEHEAWFSEFLGEGPSGHALRKSGENSPYVGKFLGAR